MSKALLKIKPKRWWWPPDRKKAKMMEIIMSEMIDETKLMKDVQQRLTNYYLYGSVEGKS